MTHYTSIKQKIINENAQQLYVISRLRKAGRVAILAETARIYPDLSPPERLRQAEFDMMTCTIAVESAKRCQTIIFMAEQAHVFDELVRQGRTTPLDFRLPFQNVLLQFTKPLLLRIGDEMQSVIGLMLEQIEATREEYDRSVASIRHADKEFGMESYVSDVDWSGIDSIVFNQIIVVTSDYDPIRIGWNSQKLELVSIDPDGTVVHADSSSEHVRKLAISCIGYINCENVYLHREEVPEKVNRKRERKGKSPLEPYYVCRIRGVNYDSHATGTGSEHGHRYDVRGHFRRLDTGKVTWVRPHQRGLKHELYIPKMYVVNKEATP